MKSFYVADQLGNGIKKYVAVNDGIEVHAYVSATGWWMKIIHVGSVPEVGELNFSSDRAAILADLMDTIRTHVKEVTV